jgi:DNA polymerase III subunit beta
MKVTFDKQKLLAALIPPAGISQTKNTLTAVDGLLFECPPNPKYGDYDTDREDLCRISAFDLDKGMRTSVECEIYEKGMFIINTVKILQIVRAMPDGAVTIEIDDKGHTRISGGYSDFEISATPGAEFPSMPMFIGDRIYSIPQHRIKKLIDETVTAVAQNDTRAAFNGAFFKIESGCMTVVGCDGNKLAAAKCQIDDGDNSDLPDAQMIIPGKFLTELTKLLKDSEDEVTLIVGRRHVFFKIDSIYFFTRVIESEYLDYNKILSTQSKTYSTQLYVSRRELLGACERASIVTEDKLGGSGRSHVKLDIADNCITMSSVSSGGSICEKVPCAMDGKDITIGFNCRFLLDSLRSSPADCDRLRIRLNSPLMGALIEPSGGTGFVNSSPDESVFGDRSLNVEKSEDDGEEFLYFIMPVRLNG